MNPLRTARNLNFRAAKLYPQIVRRMSDGISPDLIAKRDLQRYYILLEDEVRAGLGLNPEEIGYLLQTLAELHYNERTYRYIGHDLAREDVEGYGEVSALAVRLQALRPGQLMAILDLLERQDRVARARGEVAS